MLSIENLTVRFATQDGEVAAVSDVRWSADSAVLAQPRAERVNVTATTDERASCMETSV